MNKIVSRIDQYIMSNQKTNDIKYHNPAKSINTNHIEKIGFNYLEVLPDPPKNNSAEVLSELEELADITRFRNSSQTYLVYVVDREPLELFENFALKHDITLPVFKFKELYNNYIDDIITDTKNYFNRPRPIQLAKHLNIKLNVIDTESHATPAYPSGHAAYGYFAAHLFSDTHSKYKKEFFEIADKCAYARMLQGVHYRSDGKAAKLLISRIYKRIITLDNKRKVENATISQVIE